MNTVEQVNILLEKLIGANNKLILASCLEIERQIQITKFCLENNYKNSDLNTVMEFTRNNSCLSTLARFTNIKDERMWNQCVQIMKMNCNMLNEFHKYGRHYQTQTHWDLIVFRGFCIMIKLIQCINMRKFNDSEHYCNEITFKLNDIKHEIIELECDELKVDILENIFALIFLRFEHYKEEGETVSGFVCNELVLRDILNMLKHCIYEIGSNIDNYMKARLFNVQQNVGDALIRLQLLTDNSFYSNIGEYGPKPQLNYCRCDESSSNNIEPFYSIDLASSDSDSGTVNSKNTTDNVEATVDEHRKSQQHKSETDAGSETTNSSGKLRRKQLKRSSNSDAMRERRYLLNFMLASPESLICLCLGQRDYNRVQQVIQLFNLEDTHIAHNVNFTRKLQDLRAELNDLFIRSTPAQEMCTMPSTSEVKSIIETIKIITTNVHNKTLAINLIEQFFSLNVLPENIESASIIEQYSKANPFLNNYTFQNELFMHVFDIALTLGVTNADSLTLFTSACRHQHIFDNNSDYLIFLDNIQQSINSILNISIPHLLIHYHYPINSKLATKKMLFLKQINESAKEFLTTHNTDTFIKIIKHLNKHLDMPPVNYLQRVHEYLLIFSKVFNVISIQPDNVFDILYEQRSKIVDKIVYETNISPQELKSVFTELHLDLNNHLIFNCIPHIKCEPQHVVKSIKQPIEFETINYRSEIKKYFTRFNPIEYEIHPPNIKMLQFLHKFNAMLSYLLIATHPDCNERNLIDLELNNNFCLENLLNLKRVNVTKTLFKYNNMITALQNYINPQLIHTLILDENLELALNIINSLTERQFVGDTHLQHVKDAVLFCLINEMQTKDTSYTYIRQINNFHLRVQLVIAHLRYWPAVDCIQILRELLSNYHYKIEPNLKQILNEWLSKVIMYEDVCYNCGFLSWFQVYQKSDQRVDCGAYYDPAAVLESLINNEKIILAINWLQYHKINAEILYLFTVKFLKDIFRSECELSIIENILNQIPFEQTEMICINLLKILRNLNYLEHLIDYLIKRGENEDKYHNLNIGIKLLALITPNEYEINLWALIDQPILIFEQFLMNSRFEKLNQMFKSICHLLPAISKTPELISINSIDVLIRSYAEKALEFRVQQSISSTMSTSDGSKSVENRLMQSIDSVPTIPADGESFVMPQQAPNKAQWMNDYDTNMCLCCRQTIFSMFNRRHHCRRCGRVVCGQCSTKRLKISIYGDVYVRACNQCYALTLVEEESANLVGADTISFPDRLDSDIFVDIWQLTSDNLHNDTIRDEFSYEYAPSVSLSLSILKLHSQNINYPKFLLSQCKTILGLMVPSKMKMSQNEFDYAMIIQMLRSLLLAAKVNCDRNSYESLLIRCDRLLSEIDILHILASNDCLDLLPLSANYVNDSFNSSMDPLTGLDLRKLTDILIENEKWNLALEVTTKSGLDTTGIFAAWGKTCLRTGCFERAREKFKKCFGKIDEPVPSTSNSITYSNRNPPLLIEIIKILESNTCAIDPNIKDKLTTNTKLQLPLSTAIRIGLNDQAVFILNKLNNFKQLSSGNFTALYNDPQPVVKTEKILLLKRKNSKVLPSTSECIAAVHMDDMIYTECLYYLQTYGTPSSVLEFYLRRNQIKNAILHILNNKLANEYYVELFMYCLKHSLIEQLQNTFIELDKTLNKFQDGLNHICLYLEQNNLSHILYQIQKWLGDNIRAAVNCIKLFQSNATTYMDLFANLQYLYDAEIHLKNQLEYDNQSVNLDENEQKIKIVNLHKNTLKMERIEIDKHINSIWSQVALTKLLASNEKEQRPTIGLLPELFPFVIDESTSQVNKIPTLFGTKLEKIQLAVLAIISCEKVANGFGVAYQIITNYKLNASKVYCIVAKHFGVNGKYTDIQQLIENISTSGISNTEVICDEVLSMAIRSLAEYGQCTTQQIDALIKLITDINVKIDVYIEIKQLKSAYLLAIRQDNHVREMKRILREAERLNQSHIRQICASRLKSLEN